MIIKKLSTSIRILIVEYFIDWLRLMWQTYTNETIQLYSKRISVSTTCHGSFFELTLNLYPTIVFISILQSRDDREDEEEENTVWREREKT